MIMQLFRRQASGEFQTRSPDRDQETDNATLGRVGRSIEEALLAMQSEHEGLTRRLKDAEERASLAAGNNYDEYLTREPAKLDGLRKYEAQMRRASARLKALEDDIGHLKFLRATFYTRFSRLKPGEA